MNTKSKVMASNKDEHQEWVIKDNFFHRGVSNVRNTLHGNAEAAQRAMELVKAKQAQNAQQLVAQTGAHPVQAAAGYSAATAPNSAKPCQCQNMSDEESEKRALHDPTLPVLKFRYVLNRLRSEVKRAARYGHTTSVMIVSIDDFATLPQRFGNFAEMVQNEVLLAASQRFSAIIRRDVDLLGRYLNERFIIVLPETSAEQAQQFAERIRAAIEGTCLDHMWHKVTFTVSLGICTSTGETLPAEEMIMQADGAAEMIEKRGGNGVHTIAF
ncbi:MAG TPA: GGDEF domain-containing protein [Candidatus Melainabacteria bacterium]|nr:GGDEF domain-containing protein [Candidatus Melainabacteria bacterium]HIN67460.1 GGDEF domain-containing protein [Candidatus Obscuribacterales bacterium]